MPTSMTLPTRFLVGQYILSEANETRSREHLTLAPTTILLQSGTILGRITGGAQTVAAPVAGAGNVGNGVFAAPPTADANVPAGDYVIEVIAEVANAGRLRIERPDGTEDGVANVGVAYNGQINFTLNDGATDFKIGDRFVVTVGYAAGSGLYVPLDPTAVNGAQNFGAVLFTRARINTGNKRVVGHVRDCEINERMITLVNALSGPQLATMKAQAAALGVLFSGGR